MKEKEKEINPDSPVKVTMKVYKKGKQVGCYRQTRKRDFIWYCNRAKKVNLNDLSNHIYFLVQYGKGTNSKDCHSIEDLEWCYKAFYKEYLNV